MSLLFSPCQIGPLDLPNRLVRSATFEGMALQDGQVSDDLIRVYRNLARGGVGLSICSLIFVDRDGQSYPRQTGIHSDGMIPGLRRLVNTVHEHGVKVFFQLNHGGRQGDPDVIGKRPKGPSARVLDPTYFFLPREMNEGDIQRVIRAFAAAARRSMEAGADGIQLHAAHTYLLNQFLSPYFNHRSDRWGGSDENRFRLLREVYLAAREEVGRDYPIIVKLNTNDHTSRPGVTPVTARQVAAWLAELGVNGVEVSAGSVHFAFMNMCRGTVPTRGLLAALPLWKRPAAWLLFKSMEGRFDLEEAYNLKAARTIKPVLGDIPLILVGGLRSRTGMERLLQSGAAELVSMSRPFVREPHLARKLEADTSDRASCTSCNNCFAAGAMHLPLRCYVDGIPGS